MDDFITEPWNCVQYHNVDGKIKAMFLSFMGNR